MSTASSLVATPPGIRAPGLWWCKHRDRRGADLENEAMATRQSRKQTERKAETKIDTGTTNRPGALSEREPQGRNPRVRSRSAAPTDRAGATAAAAPKATLNGGEMVYDKPQQARSGSKPTAERADLATANASGKQPPASTKRARLIGMLERPEGASVAEIAGPLSLLSLPRPNSITSSPSPISEVCSNEWLMAILRAGSMSFCRGTGSQRGWLH